MEQLLRKSPLMGLLHQRAFPFHIILSNRQSTLSDPSCKYFHDSAACGIDLGDNYIVTGGYGTYNTVAMFSEAGFVKYLPNLKTSRYRHACTSFVDSNGETV